MGNKMCKVESHNKSSYKNDTYGEIRRIYFRCSNDTFSQRKLVIKVSPSTNVVYNIKSLYGTDYVSLFRQKLLNH